MPNGRRPLMGTDNILELQDNGYKSTVSAISEIIDNSIQANGKNIDVIIIRNTTRDSNEIDEILIVDDGDGMNEETFNKALQMSSGTKSRAKSGLGKYGQGLPNSSISQTKRVEVYTSQNGNILFNHIDLNEIYDSGEAYLPDTENRNEIDIPLIKSKKYIPPKTGTIVRWAKPNKVKPKTAKTLVSHIEQIAGRTFRYYIHGFKDKNGIYFKCKINILVFDYNGKNFEPSDFDTKKAIKPFDPMFLMKDTQMDALFKFSNNPTSVLYEEPIVKTFEIEYNNELVETTVEIRLSYCKKEERQRYGRNAGDTPFGKKYHKRNMIGTIGYNNISIIRAGREIDTGSFGFIGDVSDPRERWWSAEILVEPIVDSIIGVDNKKQQATEIKFIDSEDLTDYDIHEIIRWISVWLSENKSQVKKIILEQNITVPKPDDSKDGPTLPPGSETEPGDPADPDHDFDEKEKIEVKKSFRKWIHERYSELEEDEIIRMTDYALSIRDNHIFVKSDLGDTQLYSYKVFGTKVLIEINYNHSFYKRFMHQFEEDSSQEKSLRSVRLLIGAMVNAEILNKTMDKSILKDRRNIKNRMAEKLDDYIEDLYSN